MSKEAVNPETPGQPGWKAAVHKRLLKEGRWTEASRRRVALENSGVAKEDAWRKIFDEFPPLGSEPGNTGAGVGAVESETSPEATTEIASVPEAGSTSRPKARRRRDLKRDVQWVYEKLVYIRQDKISVNSAPSLGAWELGQQAKRNPQWFFKDMVTRFLKEEEQGGEGRFDDERTQFKLIEIFEQEERQSRADKLDEVEQLERVPETSQP